MIMLLIAMVWLACSVGAYLVFRVDWKIDMKGHVWTKGDRVFHLFISLLFGPIAFFTSLLMLSLSFLGSMEWTDKPSRW